MNLTQGDIFAADGPVPLTSQSATVKFSQSSVLAIPFIPVKVTVSITPPKGVDASTFPVYSGFIQLQSGSEQYQVTYLGVAAALKDKQILDNTSEFFGVPLPTILDSTGNVQNGTTNYTFVGDDFPTVLLRYVGFFFRVSDCSTSSCQPCIWHTSSTSRLSRPEHQVYTNIQQEGSYARRLLHVSPNPRQSRRTGLHSSQFGCGCKLQPCGTIAFAFTNLVEIGRGRQWL